jgi:hypothetical protein
MTQPRTPARSGDKSYPAPELPDGAEDIEGGEAEKPGQNEHDEKQSGEERTSHHGPSSPASCGRPIFLKEKWVAPTSRAMTVWD